MPSKTPGIHPWRLRQRACTWRREEYPSPSPILRAVTDFLWEQTGKLECSFSFEARSTAA